MSQFETWDETLILPTICLCTSNETAVLKMRFKIYKIDRLPFKNKSFSISHCLESFAFIGFTFLSVSAKLSSGFLILKIRLMRFEHQHVLVEKVGISGGGAQDLQGTSQLFSLFQTLLSVELQRLITPSFFHA